MAIKESIWGKFKRWVAQRTLYMAIAPWVFPVVGGIIISVNLDADWYRDPLFWLGVLLIIAGSVPLGIRDSWLENERKDIDGREAIERATLSLITDEIAEANIPPGYSEPEVKDFVDSKLQNILKSLVTRAYERLEDPRAVFFRPGKLGDRDCVFPAYSDECSKRPAKIHLDDSTRYAGINGLLTSEDEMSFENDIEGRSYCGYAAASVSQGNKLVGVLTLDTPDTYRFDEQDAQNLLSIASYFTMMLTAQSHRLDNPLTTGTVTYRDETAEETVGSESQLDSGKC